jgi:trehalose 6-phosphate synthase/phosphatase
MTPLLRRNGGIWIGWPGETAATHDEEREAILNDWARKENCFAVDLPADVASGFYEGYANQTLWPVFHYFPERLRFDEHAWRSYVTANVIFCEHVVRHYRAGDLIWVHDYHLLLLPRLLREALPDAAIGFFLHIPFPSAEVFPVLPRREELLEGLLGSDLIAFQTHGYLQQFRASLRRVLGIESRISELALGARTVRMEALPIGIAPQEYTGLLATDEAADTHYREWRSRYAGQKLLLGVDRLDYTKGVPERLRAYAHLLHAEPGYKEKIVLIQIAIPTRERIGAYEDLHTEVNRLVGEINGRFGTPDWMPVVYINRSIDRPELVALYKLSDVCWVGSLRDGLNLVAKEYVACKGEDGGGGALVLSEFAGAAAEMGGALLINPFDEQRTAAVVSRALNLDEQERRERMRGLHDRVTRNDVFHWGERFVAALEIAASARRRYADTRPKHLRPAQIWEAYQHATRRLLILDYDGTLVPFAALPQEAMPPPPVKRLLARLASDPNNNIALVSGRRRENMDQWFATIDGLWLIAEHGAEFKRPSSARWELFHAPASQDWKSAVIPILRDVADRTPGSFVEEKNHSVVWHYRLAEPEFAAWLSTELVSMLEAMLAETELRAFHGANIVEVKPVWANKGEAFDHLLALQPQPDFLFAAGDDRTDEDLFERMPRDAWTVHVGPGVTTAAFVAPDFGSIRSLLDRFGSTESPAPTLGLPRRKEE